jgi:hypothetical protein
MPATIRQGKTLSPFPVTNSGAPVNATLHFTSLTLAGNTLFCFMQSVAARSTPGSSSDLPACGTPSTPGFTWTLAGTITNPNWTISSDFDGDYCTCNLGLYFIQNASAMATSVITTATQTAPTADFCAFTFALGEISGLATSSVLDTTTSAYGAGGTTPGAGSIVCTDTDAILVIATDTNYGNLGSGYAGSGYTAISSSVGGATQLYESATPGTYATAFGVTDSRAWACLATAFVITPAAASGKSFQTQPQLIGF